MEITKPQVFFDRNEIPPDASVRDAYTGSIKELFFVRNPQFKNNHPGTEQALENFIQSNTLKPIWVHYPWLNQVVETVPESIYYELFTARNRNIINSAEQQNYRNLKIGIIGLSVGSTVVSSFAMTGGPKFQRIADYDSVEISNLNRMKGNLLDVGENKTDVCAKNNWMLDPFLELELYREGVSKESLEGFITREPGIDIFIDEMDSLDLKIKARLICRENRIPVLMATDNGDSIILDVERYDQEQNLPLFHGLIEELPPEKLATLTYREWLSMATKVVGADFLTERMQECLLEIGKSIASVPQLGTTASVAGAAIAYAARRIANGQPLNSGRYTLGFEPVLTPGYMEKAEVERRKNKTEDFKTLFLK